MYICMYVLVVKFINRNVLGEFLCNEGSGRLCDMNHFDFGYYLEWTCKN